MDIHPSTEDQALMLFLHTNDRGGWSQQNLFGDDQRLSLNPARNADKDVW